MLRRPVRQTQKSGKYLYCTVEDIVLGYATVRLAGTAGQRLTSLSVVGGIVQAGDTALVDYSSGNPVVRASTVHAEEGTPLPEEEMQEETVVTVSPNTGFYAYGSSITSLYGNIEAEIPLSTFEWNDGEFEMDGNGIIIPYSGFYTFIGTLGVQGFVQRVLDPDNSIYDPEIYQMFINKLQLTLAGSTFGPFAYSEGYAILNDTSLPTIAQAHEQVLLTQGEIVTMKALYLRDASGNDNTKLDILTNGKMYPSLVCHLLSSGRPSSQYAADGVATNPGTPYGIEPEVGAPITLPGPSYIEDDSDIEIQTDEGYLHFRNFDYAYARAIAAMQDASDAEITVDYRFMEITHGGDFRIFLRATRDWNEWNSPTSGYEFSHRNTGGISITRVQSGVRTVLDNDVYPQTTLPLKLRFQCNGYEIKARIWLSTESEPGTWNLYYNDTGGFTTAGTLQIGYFRDAGEHKMYIDNVNVHAPT